MGVTLVLSYPIPENKSSQQVLESLYKLMDILSAKRCGVFTLDCETFTSTNQASKVLQTFHDSEKPSTTFAMLENSQHLIASNTFDTILHTYLSQVFPCKKAQRIECRGQKFELCEADFIVRIGGVSQDMTVRGIIIEIEYGPSVVPQDCWDILSQVACNFIPASQIPQPPQCDIFRPSDTIRQYQQVFNSLRKSH